VEPRSFSEFTKNFHGQVHLIFGRLDEECYIISIVKYADWGYGEIEVAAAPFPLLC
jgi:hypothetical protein